jgi:hypothetical protein
MKKAILICVIAACTTAAHSFNAKGYIQNMKGQQCWYTQKQIQGTAYFHTVPGTYYDLRFDNPACMAWQSDIERDAHIQNINFIVTRWHSHSDANFATQASAMYRTSPMQTKGQCVQSKKYPGIGVAVEHIQSGTSFVGVKHASTIQGCTR